MQAERQAQTELGDEQQSEASALLAAADDQLNAVKARRKKLRAEYTAAHTQVSIHVPTYSIAIFSIICVFLSCYLFKKNKNLYIMRNKNKN